MSNLPTIQELHHDREVGFKQDTLNFLLNQSPAAQWVKEHPFQKGVKYIPIDKVEYLLQRIFGGYSVEVVEFKQLCNAIAVHVRLTVINPVDGSKIVQDGLGAVGIQVDKGETPANLGAIKSDAIMKALPAAESYAIKDAAEKLGQLFGSNLNRKDTIAFESIDKIKSKWKIETTEENGK
jgi:hypothetical protein